MPEPEPALPLHETLLGMLHEADRRGMGHEEHSLAVCELLLAVHAPAGELLGDPCGGCRQAWPCRTVLGVLGGLIPSSRPGAANGGLLTAGASSGRPARLGGGLARRDAACRLPLQTERQAGHPQHRARAAGCPRGLRPKPSSPHGSG